MVHGYAQYLFDGVQRMNHNLLTNELDVNDAGPAEASLTVNSGFQRVLLVVMAFWAGLSLLRAIDAELRDPTPANLGRMLKRAVHFAAPLAQLGE